MEKPVVLGVDIGGSHITAAMVDLSTGKLVEGSSKRETVNSSATAAELLEAWARVIKNTFHGRRSEELKIGIAMPGPFDYVKGISLIQEQEKFKSLYQVNVKEELANCLSTSPSNIRFINDAASFMQGEIFSGAAKGYKNAIGLTLGTGLGSAIAKNGVAHDAELWNSPFLGGIAEDYFSTRWFVNKYENLTGNTFAGVKELASIAETDPYAKQIFNEFGRGLGHFLADIIKENQAEVVVLGGNIAQAYHLFEPHLTSNLKAYHLTTVIKLAMLNEQAALIGGADLWNKHS